METYQGFLKIVGKRRNFCFLGPEYFGCCNTAKRARILGDKSGYSVGLEVDFYSHNWSNISFFKGTERRKALSAFWKKCGPAMKYNKRSLSEVRKAKADYKKNPLDMDALMVLGNHGVI